MAPSPKTNDDKEDKNERMTLQSNKVPPRRLFWFTTPHPNSCFARGNTSRKPSHGLYL